MTQSETQDELIKTALGLAWDYHVDIRYHAAIRTLLTAIEEFPQAVGLYQALSYIYNDCGQYQDVVNIFKGMVRNGGEHTAITWNNLGAAYQKLSQYQDAIGSYREALEMEPENATVRINLASLYHEDLNQSDRAIALLREGVEINSQDTGFYLSLSNIYIDLRQYNEVVLIFGEMENNSVNHTLATWNNLGLAYSELSREDRQEEDVSPISLAQLEVKRSGDEGEDHLQVISLLKHAFDNACTEDQDDSLRLIFTTLLNATKGTPLPSAEQIMWEWSEAPRILGMP